MDRVENMTSLKRFGAIVVAGAMLGLASSAASAQQITLRLHGFLPGPAPIPKDFLVPWAKKVEAESKGRIKIEVYHSLQLGGTPAQLYDQVKDGVVDLTWVPPGYTAGRFPKSETFELPFIAANGEMNSPAGWEFYEKHLRDEFKDVKMISINTHGPALIHAKGNGVRKLEDLKGLKIRGPSRIVNRLLETLGATPVGMPVTAMADALSKGVIDGTVVPWEVTAPLRIAELVNTHTGFSGNRSLYITFFIFAMNKAKHDSLPADLKKVIDDNSGIETSRWAGKAQDGGDGPGLEAAKRRNNAIITLDAAETARWRKAAEPVIDSWAAEMKGKNIDAQALINDARAMIAKYAGPDR
jgi:TRAP-type C4-dicarboxylate transport system substrate-binding protein